MPEPVNLVRENRGCYLLVLHRKRSGTCTVGQLGTIDVPEGYYVYTGSAKKNLSSRVSRHLHKRKKIHWHIDYLVQSADKVKAYPVYTQNDLECAIAGMISKISDADVPGFGCSDCSCRSHLFYFAENPAENRNFTDAILHIRLVMAPDDLIPNQH